MDKLTSNLSQPIMLLWACLKLADSTSTLTLSYLAFARVRRPRTSVRSGRQESLLVASLGHPVLQVQVIVLRGSVFEGDVRRSSRRRRANVVGEHRRQRWPRRSFQASLLLLRALSSLVSNYFFAVLLSPVLDGLIN